MTLALCVHVLHRHPLEVRLPISALVEIAAVWGDAQDAAGG